jgi:long-chain fatty acid transport protein
MLSFVIVAVFWLDQDGYCFVRFPIKDMLGLKLQQVLFCLLLGCLSPLPAQGQVANVLTNVGAASRGAATAMPLDASNSQYWNPASITDLPATELDLNTQVAFPHVNLESALPVNVMSGEVPATVLAGGIESGNRVNTSPSFGFVKKLPRSRWTFGMLGSATLGAGVIYPKGSNPLTAGREINVSGDLYYASTTAAYRINKHWSIGLQPNLTVASLQASPYTRAAPDDANGDGIATYPGTNRAWATGFGVQGGLYYHRRNIHLGASLKSPQWFTPFHFKSEDELGHPRHFSGRIDSPMTLSIGAGYSGFSRLKFSTDVRYIDYEDSGLGRSRFTESGSVKGPGWHNIWAFVQSAKIQVTKKCSLRLSYSYNQSPIQGRYTSFNIASPALIQHQMSAALLYRLRPDMALAISYQHGFAGSSEGPIQRSSRTIPGSSVRITSALDSVAASLIFFHK